MTQIKIDLKDHSKIQMVCISEVFRLLFWTGIQITFEKQTLNIQKPDTIFDFELSNQSVDFYHSKTEH